MRTLVLAALVALAVPALAVAAPPDQVRLAQARVDGAAKIYASALARWQSGAGTLDAVAGWSVRWLGAIRDQGLRGKPLKKALEEHRDRMKAVVTSARDRVQAGTAPVSEVDEATYYLAEAELWLARGK